jgi:predicted transposase/invertase (TIGR01784 family)
MSARFINPYTDFGFKKIFGEEASKHLLKDFLNALLPAVTQITKLDFKNAEQLGQSDLDRRAIFDIYCENQNGEKFIVELQKAKQNFFKDRTVFYSTFPIQEQAEKGNWDFKLQAVYCVGILDFTFDDYETEPEKSQVLHTIKLKDQNNKIFYDKLTYLYLEMPNFRKTEEQLSGQLDKWLYFIKNLENFSEIPRIFGNEEIFSDAFHKAELAQLHPEDHVRYQHSLKIYRDIKNVIDTAYDEGKVEGLLEGRAEGEAKGLAEGEAKGKAEEKVGIARAMKAQGLDVSLISTITSLSISEINLL